MPVSFVARSLSLADDPAFPSEALLHLILREAVARTGADAGASISIVDHPRGRLLTSAAIDDRSRAVPAPNGGAPRVPASRSAATMPIREASRVFGQLVVESSQPAYFTPERTDALAAVARDSVPSLARDLLRRRVARIGVPATVIGSSASLMEAERQTRCAAYCDNASVLITGERGSGKELIATAVHFLSDRHERPFLPVLSSAFAEGLFADELFGHERFAFTGAGTERDGKFRAAEGGTLFLDEVADLRLDAQAALLRVLERGEVARVGRDKPLAVNVRVVAATNRNLPALIAVGSFRHDLFDRLSVFEIVVPPLRARKGDIRALARHYLRNFCHSMGRASLFGAGCPGCSEGEPARGCATPAFFGALECYDWPGNIRELMHVLQRTMALHIDEEFDVRHLPAHVREAHVGPGTGAVPDRPSETLDLNQAIGQHIRRVLRLAKGNKSEAARLLGIPRSTMLATLRRVSGQQGTPGGPGG